MSYTYTNRQFMAIRAAARKRHADVCKAMQHVGLRYDTMKEINPDIDSSFKLPVIWLDESRSTGGFDNSKGEAVIQVYIECCDCGASGFIDIPVKEIDENIIEEPPAPPKALKSSSQTSNRMGGPNVSEKYIQNKTN